jgi:hypothetical protein
MGLWWVRRGDQTFGPVDETALVNALREGRIQPGDLACREGGQEWLLVSSVPGVAEVFAPKRSQPPPQGQDPWREAAWMIGNMDGEIIEGPLSLEDVKTLMARGTLTGGELIARVGSSAWQQIPDVLAEYGRATSNRPAPAPVMRTTIPPVPMPTGHPSTPPPALTPRAQPPSGSMASTQTAPVSVGPPSVSAMHSTQTSEIAPAFLAPPIVHPSPPASTAPAQPPRPTTTGGPPRPAPRFATTQTAPRPSGAPSTPVAAPSTPVPSAHAPTAQPPSAPSSSAQSPSAQSPSAQSPSAQSPSAQSPSAQSPSGQSPSAPPPVRAQPAGADAWYFSRAGVPVGPMTQDQLRSSVLAGEVLPDTPVCRVDEWLWKPFSAFPELSRRSAPPPLPSRNRTR